MVFSYLGSVNSSGTPSVNYLSGLGIDEIFTRTDSSTTETYLTDILGSVIGLADGTGAINTEYGYSPFGETSRSGTASGNAFGFTGREADGTGLYYYRARYYHPEWGRFISEDPIGFAGGDVNLYAYVGNSPLCTSIRAVRIRSVVSFTLDGEIPDVE